MALFGFTGKISNNWNDTVLNTNSGAIVITNWTGDIVPASTDDVVIGGPGQSFDVLINSGAYQHTGTPDVVNTADVAAGSSLTISGGGSPTFTAGLSNNGSVNISSSLTVGNSIANDGLITINAGYLKLIPKTSPGTVELTGALGDLRLNGDSHSVFLTGSDPNAVTVLENSSTISGSGLIGFDNNLGGFSGGILVVHNHGIVNANKDSAPLLMYNAGVTNLINAVTNDGTLEDTGLGGLVLFNTTVIQGGSGVIGAFGDGAHVDLAGGNIRGGNFATSGTGVVQTGTIGGNAGGQNILDGSTAAGAITNTGHFRVQGGTGATLRGSIVNTGQIELSPANHGSTINIDVGDVTLSGAGSIVMHPVNSGEASGITGGSTITPAILHNVDNTISGKGTLGANYGSFGDANFELILDNQANGVINADQAFVNPQVGVNPQLVLHMHKGAQNAGLIEDTGTAGLVILETTVTQAATGVITAQGAGAHVDLNQSKIVGGTISTASGGEVRVISGSSLTPATLDGSTVAGAVNNSGSLVMVGGANLVLQGTINNTGSVTVGGVGHSAILTIAAGDVTLTGSGNAILQHNNELSEITGFSAATATTLHNVNNTISGAGTIGANFGAFGDPGFLLVLDNAGTIRATEAFVNPQVGVNQMLVIRTGGTGIGVTNHGIIEAQGTAGLRIQDTRIDNDGGVIQAQAGTHVDLQHAFIYGGTLKTFGDGVIQTTDSNTTIDGIDEIGGALNNLALLQVSNGTTLSLVGTMHNSGTVAVGTAGGAAILNIGATLDGGGKVLLSDSTSSVTGGITNFDNTISGAGTITAIITNQGSGVIAATYADHALTLNTGHTINNDAVLRADGGTLIVNDAVAGSGHAEIGSGGTISFHADFQQNVTFLDEKPETLRLAAAYAGTITDFHNGDAIDLDFITFNSGERAVWAENANNTGGDLSLLNTSNAVLATLHLTGIYQTSQFAVASDGGHAHIDVTGYVQVGTPGDDVLAAIGTDGNMISGLGGNDTLNGGSGNDTIFAGAGQDTVNGSDGNDTLVGNDDIFASEPDTLSGGNGNDTILGEPSDTVAGGAGIDTLFAVNSNAWTIDLHATSIETMQAGFGDDHIDAASQTAGVTVFASGGNDTVIGSPLDDFLWGGAGNDTLTGGAGNDLLFGDVGADTLSGGDNNDTIYADGSDTIDGGDGHDVLYWTDTVTPPPGDLAALSIEWVQTQSGDAPLNFASGSNDVIAFAGSGNNTVTGGAGNDFLWGEAGNDILFGGAGNDALVGGAGADQLNGGAGTDNIYGNIGGGGDGAADTYVFDAPTWGTDFVYDFDNSIDKFDMHNSGAADFSALTVTASGAHAQIAFGGNLIVVVNAAGLIDAGDFVF